MTFEAYDADTAYDADGGNCLHEAWVQNGRVFLSNNDDTHYQQDFKSREALQKFVDHLWSVADQAWPSAPTGNLLVGNADAPPPSIVFNTGKDYKEIAKFTEEGFYYKGEFVDDAGEVHRLLKDVLNGICYKQLCKDLVDELENWIAYGDEECIVKAHALVDRAHAILNS